MRLCTGKESVNKIIDDLELYALVRKANDSVQNAACDLNNLCEYANESALHAKLPYLSLDRLTQTVCDLQETFNYVKAVLQNHQDVE